MLYGVLTRRSTPNRRPGKDSTQGGFLECIVMTQSATVEDFRVYNSIKAERAPLPLTCQVNIIPRCMGSFV